MNGLLIVAIAIVVLARLLWRLYYTKERAIIDQLPGPPSLPFLGNIIDFAFLDQQGLLDLIVNYAKLYYPVYRTWNFNSPMIHVSEPRHAEVFLSSSQNINKNFIYDFLKIWLGDGLLVSSGSKWQSRRKMLTPAFHFKILDEFIPMFSEKSKILVNKLRATADNVDTVDIVPYVTLCALDIICETAMGTAVNAQEDVKSPYVAAIHEINVNIMYRMLRPHLFPDLIFHVTPYGFKVIRERREALRNKPKNEENEMIHEGKKRIAFLDLLIGMSENDKSFTDNDIREEVDTFMFEGHDTTAMGMSWVLYFLASNPDIQRKCMEEMESIFEGSNRDPTMKDLQNMNYLERVIKESLRLRPSVYSIGRTLKHSVVMDGYDIPAGTDVAIDIYNVHRDPKNFPDPEKFDPDRFLPENCVERHPFAYIPFSAGSRNCIGQRFALLEEKSVISTVLRNFELRAVSPERDYACIPDLILRPKYGVNVKLLPRY